MLVAVIVGLGVSFDYSAAVIAVLGAVGGYFIAEDDRSRFLIGAIALYMVSGALGDIPAVGEYISGALGGLSSLFNAAAVTAIVLTTIDKVKP
ncbi:MAG: hypothetical protein V3S15_07345 [Woeseiaceae bacterium]